ncbi:MAG: histidine kinase, partial [Lachnospiraceae bacterium]|nr:histidine kinase [Lachnospiraceae bacterium]
MMSKLRSLPLSYKISGIYLIANLFIFIVDIALLLGINALSVDMQMAYQDNRRLNELLLSLDSVQDAMTGYLNSKTTDSLSDYYISEQRYSELVGELGTQITDRPYGRMERNIKNMSADYLDDVSQTIEAKRGRNVEKYRIHYEEATRLYEYIKTYIRSLNEERFVTNSEMYTTLAGDFRIFEFFAVAVMFVVLFGSASIIIRITGTLIDPLRQLSLSADEVANGNLDATLPESRYNDEIGKLTSAFGKMMVSIKEYIERIRMSMEKERAMQEKELMMETHLKDAQLKYLQAQINPHFLFNTLNAGAQLAMMEGADRTYEYVQTVADFFRYNVKKQDELVNLEDEVELVDNYIRI